MTDKIVYGPESSFYDERDEPAEFRIYRELDGLFFEFVQGEKQIACCTLVRPQLEKLLPILEREIKRIKKGGN